MNTFPDLLDVEDGSAEASAVMGKPYPAELRWEGISCTAFHGSVKYLLSDCTGIASPGETVAFMGPSGAGTSRLPANDIMKICSSQTCNSLSSPPMCHGGQYFQL